METIAGEVEVTVVAVEVVGVVVIVEVETFSCKDYHLSVFMRFNKRGNVCRLSNKFLFQQLNVITQH